MERGKMGQKHLSLWKPLFLQMFDSLDLLGPKEIFLSFEQNLSKYFVDPYILFPDISHVR